MHKKNILEAKLGKMPPFNPSNGGAKADKISEFEAGLEWSAKEILSQNKHFW